MRRPRGSEPSWRRPSARWCSQAACGSGPSGGAPAGRASKRRTGRSAAGLAELLATGGVPKDLELGLVDFLGLVRGHEVNLCWRYGEKQIRFWHGLDEGFGGRKAIPENETEA